jgi:hypothetical protein
VGFTHRVSAQAVARTEQMTITIALIPDAWFFDRLVPL